MRTHLTAAASLTAAALLVLTACSSNPSTPIADKAPSPTPSTSAAPKIDPERAKLDAAVRAYSAAYFKPDGAAAYATLSKRCQTKAGPSDMFAAVANNAAKAYGKQEIQTLTIDALAGDMARVTYTYSVPKLNQTGQPWLKEAGAWHYDGC